MPMSFLVSNLQTWLLAVAKRRVCLTLAHRNILESSLSIFSLVLP